MADLSSDLVSPASPVYERLKRVISPPEWATFADDVDAILEL
jgi:quinolinate synthase